VHHVAVPLDREQVADADAAELRDATDVVAGEVHEHDVLGPLLRVGQQFVGEPPVVVGCAAAGPGAGERAVGDLAVLDPAHDLRRRPHQRDVAGPDVEHERARVHHPQGAVHVERAGAGLGPEPLAEHDLEDVAGVDVLDRSADRRLELRLREVRTDVGEPAGAALPVSMSVS